MATTSSTSVAVNRTRAIAAFCDAKAKGASNPDARKAADAITKVNYNYLQLRWYGDSRNPNGVVPFAGWHALTEDQKDAQVVIWRADEGRSWGEIAILADWEPESRVRTRWERGSKLSSTGHRTGQGGRFAFNDARLYAANHKGLGAELTDKELRELRNDPEAMEAYLAQAAEYKSKMGTKATAAKKRIKAKATKEA